MPIQLSKPNAPVSGTIIATQHVGILKQDASGAHGNLQEAHDAALSDWTKFREVGPLSSATLGRITNSRVDGWNDPLKNQLDSMSEMGETESLRLQMAMDRLSKFIETLSNIEKKLADTGDAITQNLK